MQEKMLKINLDKKCENMVCLEFDFNDAVKLSNADCGKEKLSIIN